MTPEQPKGMLRADRLLGSFCLLYSFSHAFFGVAAIKTVQNGWGYLEAPELLSSALLGLAWGGMFCGSIILFFGRAVGRRIVLSGSIVSAAAAVARYEPVSGGLWFPALLIAVHPLSDICLGLLLYTFDRLSVFSESRKNLPSRGLQTTAVIISSGILLPWLVRFCLLAAGLPAAIPKLPIAFFMTFWYALPFVCLALLSRILDSSYSLPVAGGVVGASAALVLVSFMMWGVNFDSFLMPLSSPLRFIGAGAGFLAGLLMKGLLQRAGAL